MARKSFEVSQNGTGVGRGRTQLAVKEGLEGRVKGSGIKDPLKENVEVYKKGEIRWSGGEPFYC